MINDVIQVNSSPINDYLTLRNHRLTHLRLTHPLIASPSAFNDLFNNQDDNTTEIIKDNINNNTNTATTTTNLNELSRISESNENEYDNLNDR